MHFARITKLLGISTCIGRVSSLYCFCLCLHSFTMWINIF